MLRRVGKDGLLRRRVTAAVLSVVVAALGGAAFGAQVGARPPLGRIIPFSALSNAKLADTDPGGFRFCRLRFRNSPFGDGDGWYVDSPRADLNISLRLSQLTRVAVDEVGEDEPVHVVVALGDPAIFQCPFLMMTEAGGLDLNEQEATQLREYLLKGGFLWADDFWGSRAWEWFSGQMGKALPPREYPIVDLPLDHPIFHTMFDVREFPQVPNVGLWERAHLTSERGADSAVPHARGILDHSGRVMVFMTFNTDFGDAFERESDSPDYFARFSVPGYQIALDVILYALTH